MARQSTCLKTLLYKGEIFFYSKKRIQSLRLRLNDKGEWVLSILYYCAFWEVYNFLEDSWAWRVKAKQKFILNFLNDEMIFLAKKYKIVFCTHAKKTHFNKNTIITCDKASLDLFLRQNAKKIFSFYLKKWNQKTGLIYTHLSIKNMRTRWGSCN